MYWITNALFSAAQTHAVRSDGLRASLGLPAMSPGDGGGGGMPVPRHDWAEAGDGEKRG